VSIRSSPPGLAVALAISWLGVTSAQQITFRLPEDDPNTNCDVVRSAAFSPDGSLLAVGYGRFVGLLQESRPGQTVLWEALSGKRKATFVGRIDGVCSVAFSPDGRILASAEYPGLITLWNVPSGREHLAIKAPAWVTSTIAFSPNGKLLAAGLWTGATNGVSPPGNDVILWDAASGTPVRTLKGHSNAIRGLGFSPDGKSLVTGSMDGTAKVWDIANGMARATLESPSLRKQLGREIPIGVESTLFSPDGRTIVVSAGTIAVPGKMEGVGEVTLWTAPSGPVKATLKGLNGFVKQVAFSPDGKLLATVGGDQSVQMWNTTSLQEVGKLRGTAPITFSPDGKELVWGTAERTLVSQKIAEAIQQSEPGRKLN